MWWAPELTALISDGETAPVPRMIYTLADARRWDRVPGVTLVICQCRSGCGTATRKGAYRCQQRTIGAFQRSMVETLHYLERKHAPCVLNFHLLQCFHAGAAEMKAAQVANRTSATVPACDGDALLQGIGSFAANIGTLTKDHVMGCNSERFVLFCGAVTVRAVVFPLSPAATASWLST
jgi:hypothetical protein